MSQQPDVASNPEVKALVALTANIVAEAEAFQVVTPQQYADAGEVLKRIKGHQKKLEDTEMSMTRPINAGLKMIRDFFRSPRESAARAEGIVKRSMLAYSQEQERLRREEQLKAEERARKEQEKLAAQAERAAASGQHAKAEALQDRAASVVAPVVQREAPKVQGLSVREVWRFEVVDPSAVPREFLMVDEKKIGGVVRAMKGDTKIAGVRVWPDQSLAAGAA